MLNYDEYSNAVAQIAEGRTNILTTERIELLEPTSGSSTPTKLIPFTASLRKQFQRAVAVWIADVFQHRPAVRKGRAYWSISPALKAPPSTIGGVTVGFDDDAFYLSRTERLFLRYLLVMPPEIARLHSIKNFRYITLLHLLAAGDLSLISIWSPTFLTSLLSDLDAWSCQLSHDLKTGNASPPVPNDPGLSDGLSSIKCDKERGELVGHILQCNDPLPHKLNRLWPQLDLISCWADATAGPYARGLRELFPKITIQPKGLLSTEACVSFPRIGREGAALALRSHFFEFVPEQELAVDSSVYLAHELKKGERYEVVVTTGGGFYRYRLRDVVQVMGFENECPLLKFVGRADRVSDLVGEKLNEAHVSLVLQEACQRQSLFPVFAMLVPVPEPAGYRLYIEVNNTRPGKVKLTAVLHDVETGLQQNPQYRYALQVGQLRPLDLRVVVGNNSHLWQVYERILTERGCKVGDIKPAALDLWTGWEQEFEKEELNYEHLVSPVVE